MNLTTLERYATAFLDQALWYFIWTIPFFLVFWVLGKRYFAKRRIQPVQRADTRQFLAEIRHSLGFVLLYAVADVWVLHSISGEADTAQALRIYTDINQHGGWAYAAFTCFVLFVIDDTWFYWMHRAIHSPWLYQHIHRVHHDSIDTTPFTAYRFHPLEGVLEMGSAVLVIGYAALVPVHLGAIVAWQVGAIAFNVIGHLGYEIYPAWWTSHWLLKWKTPSTHHNLHHERFDGNYGLYFLWWDRLMHTEIKDYEATYRALFNRSQAGPEVELRPALTTGIQPEAAGAYSLRLNEVPAGFVRQQPEPSKTPPPAVEPSSAQQSLPLPEPPAAQLRLTLQGQTRYVPVQPGELLLDAALRAGVAVPYSCRRGRCGTCRATCTSGQVTMREEQTFLTAVAVAEGQVLLCQATVSSTEVAVHVS